MSHTDKDVPYWVRLNREGTLTDHDHLHFGQSYYKRVFVKDESGQALYQTVPRTFQAREITGYMQWYGVYYTPVCQFPEPVRRLAHQYVANGEPYRQIEYGTQQAPVYEQVLYARTADHCTEGEKIASNARASWYALPCTPKLPAGAPWYKYGSTNQHKGEHDYYYPSQRTMQRGALTSMAKRWNSGDDLEDWDEDVTLTSETYSFIYW